MIKMIFTILIQICIKLLNKLVLHRVYIFAQFGVALHKFIYYLYY
jgi:hypothetical protein